MRTRMRLVGLLALGLVLVVALGDLHGLGDRPDSVGGGGSNGPLQGAPPRNPGSGNAAPGETGGNATTEISGKADGTGKGTSQPPVLSPLMMQRRMTEQESVMEQTPVTPVDPTAALRDGPPLVPATDVMPAPISEGSAGTQSPAAPGTFVFRRNFDLGSGASLIGETSHASVGPVVLETWNWGAAISRDLGQTWLFYNPATLFPTRDGGFCCDQVAYYDQSHDMMIWILQYSNNGSGNNAIRVAWAKGQASVAAASFCYTDFTAQQLGATYGPSGTNYDQPKFARSNNFYYLDIQRYGTASGPTIIRFPVSTLTNAWPSCTGVSYSWFIPTVYSPGFTQRAYSTMYFAGHVTNSQLRVYSWPESVDFGGITSATVNHTAHNVSYPMRCPRTGGNATSDWCQRRSFGGGWAHSDRIFTGWVAGGAINFMWDSTQGTGGFGTFNYPYVHAVRINESTKALISEPIMWNGSYAFVYPSAALNDRYHVAGTVMWGGGSNYQNCAVFIWDDFSATPAPWEVYFPRNSNSDPSDTLSGDYFATRRNGLNGNTWSGSCYTLVGGTSSVHPYYLWFGRQRDFFDIFLPLLRKP